MIEEWLLNDTPVNRAIQVALDEHQFDRPTLLHVLRVGAAGKTEDEQIVGFLHDVIEDNIDKNRDVITLWLRKFFAPHIVESVLILTRHENESYETYIRRVAETVLAKAVKITDLKDNLSRDDGSITPERKASLRTRYLKALDTLEPEWTHYAPTT